MTNVNGAHCTWCGAAVTGAQRYCAGCGRPVEDTDSNGGYGALASSRYAERQLADRWGDQQDTSESLVGKLVSAVGTIIAIPLALIVGLIGTALPILIVVGLFMGPGDTWDMVRAWVPDFGGGSESATCQGFDEWNDASNERADRLAGLIKSVEDGDVQGRTATLAIVDDMQAIATEQRQSDPPTEAAQLNETLADMYGLLARGSRDAVNGDSSNLQRYDSEYRALVAEAETERNRVFDECQ